MHADEFARILFTISELLDCSLSIHSDQLQEKARQRKNASIENNKLLVAPTAIPYDLHYKKNELPHFRP
jgi:hypothetical protein